jgi:hypothetical protein
MRCTALTVAAVVGAGSAWAEPPGFGSSDAVQLKAKAALEQDPALKSLSLLVSVRDGVVLVTGGVPDAETAARIETVLTKVPGVSVVRVSTWPATAPDPLAKAVVDRMAGTPPPVPMESKIEPMLAVNPVLPGKVATGVPALPAGTGAAPRPADTVTVQRIDPPPADGLLRQPVVANTGSTKLPPNFDVPPPPSGPAGYPTIRATRVPVAPVAAGGGADVALSLLAIRKSEPRFADLVAEVRGGSAVVTGTAPSRADAEAFAAEVEKIRGIDRVTVGSIRLR